MTTWTAKVDNKVQFMEFNTCNVMRSWVQDNLEDDLCSLKRHLKLMHKSHMVGTSGLTGSEP